MKYYKNPIIFVSNAMQILCYYYVYVYVLYCIQSIWWLNTSDVNILSIIDVY